MFASFDAVTGAGIAQFNGAAVRTVALALDAASPALGGASAGAAATDARGTPRASASTDIGAFEEARVFVAPEPDAPSLIVTTTDDAVDTSDRVTSLREAVGVMSDGISEGAIIIEGDQVLTLTAGELVIASAVTINCAASVSAGGASRAMRVDGGGWPEFNGTLLTSGVDTDGAGGGGALVADGGRLTFNGGGVSGSVTASCYGGGGIMVRGGRRVEPQLCGDLGRRGVLRRWRRDRGGDGWRPDGDGRHHRGDCGGGPWRQRVGGLHGGVQRHAHRAERRRIRGRGGAGPHVRRSGPDIWWHAVSQRGAVRRRSTAARPWSWVAP